MTVANIFTSAWQISAVAERTPAEKERFFSNVYSVYTAVAFAAASGVILTAQISTRLLAAPGYYAAWRYVPVLTLATTFACLGSFLSSIYMAEQRSTATFATTMLGAACNLVGNFFLIRYWGSMGAAVSTLLSYILIFAVRAVHTRSLLRLHWSFPKLAVSALLLAAQCVMMERDVPFWPLWSAICLLGICAIHLKALLRAVKSGL